MNALERLTASLTQLAIKAEQTDLKNSQVKAHRLIENTNLFSAELFVSQSDRFSPYIKEVQHKIPELKRLLQANRNEISTLLLHQIEQQISALTNALHSNAALHQAPKRSFDAHHKAKLNRAKSQNNYKNAAKKLLLNSQQLYQKLREHHEFERRLMDMLTERESQRMHCKANENKKLSAEVLALHQRLGRCRKAISVIERDIELAEKRH
ncbi:MAG: primosomal replication protein [Litorilituus sp.]|jgi:primosomal replication protein N''|nr:primosomal replication protein [Litorilituus sp.]